MIIRRTMKIALMGVSLAIKFAFSLFSIGGIKTIADQLFHILQRFIRHSFVALTKHGVCD